MISGKPAWWESAKKFLEKDQQMSSLMKKYGSESLVGKGDLFRTFVNAIVGQQISVIAAEAIWNRLVEKVGEVTPENMSKFSHDEIASCGLTKSKTSYILGIAKDPHDFLSPVWEEMDDEQIRNHLVSFRGIGPWTAEMLMIFGLLRPDVFSIGDIGLVKAVQKLQPDLKTKEQIANYAEKWSPYKTAASWYLWRMLDPVPVAY